MFKHAQASRRGFPGKETDMQVVARRLALLLTSLLFVGAAGPGFAEPGQAGPLERFRQQRARLPLEFVENRGQWPAAVRFAAARSGAAGMAAGFEPRAI